MECPIDEQAILELSKSYIIPKTKPNDVSTINASILSEPECILQTPTYNSRRPIQAKPPAVIPDPTAVDMNYYQYFLQASGGAVNVGTSMGPMNMLKRVREEPKTSKAHLTYKDTFKDLNDETLPKELREQFQPLFCKLCTAQLGSTVNAKLHYNSKNHDKKVRKFLIEHAVTSGEPLHKRARTIPTDKSKNSEEEYNPRHFHCEVCDLPLTGKLHADSHYMGKNHQKAVNGKKVAGKGFLNDGQWVRTSGSKTDTSGRGGFGQDFIIAYEKPPEEYEKPTALRCELCKVAVTSLPQMEMHLNGQKHLKKMRNFGQNLDQVVQQQAPTSDGPDNLLPSTISLYAQYRTPSGQFYCKNCDVSLNSESQFSAHLQSKKHIKKNIANIN